LSVAILKEILSFGTSFDKEKRLPNIRKNTTKSNPHNKPKPNLELVSSNNKGICLSQRNIVFESNKISHNQTLK
jgi:hypothetical protein